MSERDPLRFLPNIISSSRVLLAAGFAATDHVDARLDPIADRIFALVAVTTFLVMGALSPLGYFVMISRDIATAVGFLVAKSVSWLRPVEFKARLSGKIVTVLQLLAFGALLKAPQFVTPMLWLIGVASAYSIVDYTIALWRARAR